MRYRTSALLLLISFMTSGCSMIVDSQLNKFTNRLSNTVMDFEDPETVGSAIPTLLIILDSAANGADASGSVKLTAAQMYGAYSGAFVKDPARQKILSRKGYQYAKEGSCLEDKRWCAVPGMNNSAFNDFAKTLEAKDVALTYSYAVAWLGYIQTHSDNWAVVAELGRAKTLLQKVAEFDETHDNGGAHLYLGAIATTLPPALGGQPEVGRKHFERAIELTNNQSLLIKVEFARRYARGTFDQAFHNQLLTEVLAANPNVKGLTLMNTWAQQQARELLATESDYFD